MSKQVVAEVIALIELGMIAPEDIVKCLRKANSEPEQALAAPVQEPVAYLCENAVGHKYFRWKKPSSEFKPIALYTTPPAVQRQWVGLTDEEVVEIMRQVPHLTIGGWLTVEAKLKEKNT